MFFLAPFALRRGESRELRSTLQRASGEFVVTSVADAAAGPTAARRVTHATGKVWHVDAGIAAPLRADIAALRTRCTERIERV